MELTKKELRTEVLHNLQEMEKELFHEKCVRIRDRLFSCDLWRQARTVAVTLSVGREIETTAIIMKAWAERKQVAAPKCEPVDRRLTFHKLESFDQLEIGFCGLMEPDPSKAEKMGKDNLDLLIVPGVVFDQRGYRIGYGGGYYDRFLKNYYGRTVSLLFENQLIAHVPEESHDRRVDMLITEKECIRASDRRMNEKTTNESD